MYSTSSEKTRVIWAAHSNAIGFTDEIGHFQTCNGAAVPATPFGVDAAGNPISCTATNTEDDGEPADADDNYCFPASASSLVQIQGCTDTNTGFDGTSYRAVWGDGSSLHPTPIQFTSPLTGPAYNNPYQRAALEADLPRIEARLRPDDRRGLHADPADRRRGAGAVLSVLQRCRPAAGMAAATTMAPAACGSSARARRERSPTSARTRATGHCWPTRTWCSAATARRIC